MMKENRVFYPTHYFDEMSREDGEDGEPLQRRNMKLY